MPTPEFKVNTYRYDPYKNFKFRIKWDGKYVAGVSKVGGLSRNTQVVKHRSGSDPSTPRVSPGQSEYEPITLERKDGQTLVTIDRRNVSLCIITNAGKSKAVLKYVAGNEEVLLNLHSALL